MVASASACATTYPVYSDPADRSPPLSRRPCRRGLLPLVAACRPSSPASWRPDGRHSEPQPPPGRSREFTLAQRPKPAQPSSSARISSLSCTRRPQSALCPPLPRKRTRPCRPPDPSAAPVRTDSTGQAAVLTEVGNDAEVGSVGQGLPWCRPTGHELGQTDATSSDRGYSCGSR